MSKKWLPLDRAVQMVLRADSYCLGFKMSEIYFFRFFKPLDSPFLAPKCVKNGPNILTRSNDTSSDILSFYPKQL